MVILGIILIFISLGILFYVMRHPLYIPLPGIDRPVGGYSPNPDVPPLFILYPNLRQHLKKFSIFLLVSGVIVILGLPFFITLALLFGWIFLYYIKEIKNRLFPPKKNYKKK